MVGLNDLPDEVLEFILSYLPPYKDLEICEQVCKRWKGSVKNVLHRSKINFQKGLTDYLLCWTTHSTNSNLPSGRFSHAYCLHDGSMYIFGGLSSSDTTFNDLWRFDLSKRQWVRPITMGNYPSPKGSATMIPYENKLILFGGWRYPSFHPPHQPWCLFDELHCYDIAENRWIVQNSNINPPLMAGHSASLHGNQMIIFGGFQCGNNGQNTSSNEVWSLDLKTFRWKKPDITGVIKPAPRYGQIQIALDNYHVMIIGGSGGFNNLFSDCWILNMTKDIWQWHKIPIKNSKWSATHMWNSPACRVGNKIIICGPTPSVPPDFQILKQRTIESGNFGGGAIGIERNRLRMQPINNIDLIEQRRRPAVPINNIDNQQMPALINNNNNVIRNNLQNNLNNNVEQLLQHQLVQPAQPVLPPAGNLMASSSLNILPQAIPVQGLQQPLQLQPQLNNEAANRLQRNLALRSRENDIKLPLRFNEQQDGRIFMAAFHVQQSNPIRIQREYRQQERLRRLDEKLNQFRNAKKKQEAAAAAEAAAIAENIDNNKPKDRSIQQQQQQQQPEEPKAKRAKKNVLGMFVCDISNVLNPTNPFLEWLEYKNYGILAGAPERLIFSSMIPGNGELLLFGGVQKESLCSQKHKVSNSIHFLTIPKEII